MDHRLSARSLPLLLTALALAGCASAPKASPAAGLAQVDLVVISTPGDGTRQPSGFQSRDLARIRAILEIIRGPGDWAGTWHTFPGGKVHIGFQSGDRTLGAAWFGEGYLIARADSTTKMRSITRAEYDSLMKLTVWWPPAAGDYVTFDTLTAPPAPVDYSADPDARRFRSQLEGTRFADLAGHFAIVKWECGTECVSHMVLDLKTGRPYTDTLLHLGCQEISPDRTSALVIATPASWARDRCGQHTRYLVWEGEHFRELATPWLLNDTLKADMQLAPTTQADTDRAVAILHAIPTLDSIPRESQGSRTVVALLGSDTLVTVADPDEPPAEAVMVYTVIREVGGRIVRVSEEPVSQSGDGVESMTHYFDTDERTIAVQRYRGRVTGCLLPPAESGGEDQAVSTGETATWIFDTVGRTVAKQYRREGGEPWRDLTDAENCSTMDQATGDKYASAAALVTVTGLRRFLR